MTSTVPIRMCLVGLPKTGKTTYIAALWAYLRSGAPEAKYRVPVVPADTTYLNAIATAWARRDAMPRSSSGGTDTVEFTIEIDDHDPVTVVLPDLPGEMFLNAVRRTSIDLVPADAVLSSDLLLLFVNGKAARTFAPLGDQEPPGDEEGEEEDEDDVDVVGVGVETLDPFDATDMQGVAADPNPLAPAREFAIGDLDTDTLNTELLQRLLYLRQDRPVPPIVVVVSAWDALDDVFNSPDAWLKQEQPMTWQYLQELERTTTIGVIGVSAQGADYEKVPDIHHTSAVDRAWGRDNDGKKTDVAGPLLWFDAVRQMPLADA